MNTLINEEHYHQLVQELKETNCKLVAVSKTKPKEAIHELYKKGQRDFGENRAQELAEKHDQLPKDIKWHMIGHLQRNKVKYIAPFVHLIHSVDSFRLLKEVNKEGGKNQRVIPCLLQLYVADEETKFGFDLEELRSMLDGEEFKELKHVEIKGVMAMASFTDDKEKVRKEFETVQQIYTDLKTTYFLDHSSFREISIGMSADYKSALDCGSTMIRIGSKLFGERNYK